VRLLVGVVMQEKREGAWPEPEGLGRAMDEMLEEALEEEIREGVREEEEEPREEELPGFYEWKCPICNAQVREKVYRRYLDEIDAHVETHRVCHLCRYVVADIALHMKYRHGVRVKA
jgi:hypothetical protein